jgi:hypothetical protein
MHVIGCNKLEKDTGAALIYFGRLFLRQMHIYSFAKRTTFEINTPGRSKCNFKILYMDFFYDWFIAFYCFTSRSKIFHLYGDVTIAGEGLHNLCLCSAPRAVEQGRIFIVPHLLWHGTSVFPVSPKGRPTQSPFTTHKGVWRTYSNPDPHVDFFVSRLTLSSSGHTNL